jgi:hypothetical protein
MSIKKILTITLLCAGFASAAQGQVVSQAYELFLSNFMAPTTANSGISFKECDDCDNVRSRVTDATSYTVNGKRVRLEDFRQAVDQARGSDDSVVVVLHHLESDTVISIDVSY